MHKNNKHSGDYKFEVLVKAHEALEPFVHLGKSKKKTINFSDPKAVKALNTALLKHHYNIDYWEFSEKNLCPPIPGRVEYIHIINDLLKSTKVNRDILILDVGTGATCIYPILGQKEYGWDFIGSETDKSSYNNALKILKQNNLDSNIQLRFQPTSEFIFNGIIKTDDKFVASICNPPFYKSKDDAHSNNAQKLKGINSDGTMPNRNFSGTPSELIYKGGEKAFLHNYLYQSSLFKNNCLWYTVLVSKKDLLKSMKDSLKKLGVKEIQIIPMKLGNKISRIIAWTFLDGEERLNW